nr:ubiquitin-conjugating enzyme E2 R2 isoform X2 [Taeniopygia guttata]
MLARPAPFGPRHPPLPAREQMGEGKDSLQATRGKGAQPCGRAGGPGPGWGPPSHVTLLLTRRERDSSRDFSVFNRTILLSVISLLNEPNTFSPANVDASVMFRKWRDSKGKDKEYAEIIRKQVLATKAEAEKDGVKVPTTLAEYCIKTKVPSNDNSSDLLYDDLYDDDIDDEDEEEEDADCYDDDDSGNEES